MTVHVAVDCRLAMAGGHRTYVSNLVPRLASLEPAWRWTLLGYPSLAGVSWTRRPGVQVRPCAAPLYGLREQVQVTRAVPRDADVFWSPHYVFPWFARAPVVVTVHDLAHLRLPEYTRHPARRAYARLMFAGVARRAAGIIVDSEFTLAELRTLIGHTAATPEVVPLGVSAGWFTPSPSASPVDAPYFVFVGNLKPHKNLRRLLEAMTLLPDTVPERLVVIGRSEGLRTRERGDSRAALLSGTRIVDAGAPDDETVRAIVARATALVLPSRYEGFGLPALEAMAAGVPVIAGRAASLPEVCGEAARYVDHDDVAQIRDALCDLSRDATLRERLAGLGRARARRFDWDETARRTLAVLRRVSASGAAPATSSS